MILPTDADELLFCEMKSQRLTGHAYTTVNTPSSFHCLQECLSSQPCYSVNYQKSTGVCELFDVSDLDYPNHLLTGGSVADFSHFTSRKCT